MDPVTAAILIGMAVSSAVGVYQNNKAVKARNAANKEQEKLRVDSVRAQIGAADQAQNLAMGTAANRNNVAPMQPSFAAAALSGNNSSDTARVSSGSSGTF